MWGNRRNKNKYRLAKTGISQRSGFTLIELIIVIAIGAILSTAGFLSFSGYRNKKDIEFSLNEISSAVEGVRDRSITQKDGHAWGIRFNSSSTGADSYEIFYGSSYSAGSVESSRGFRRPVEFSEPSGGRTVDLTFGAATGEIDSRKVISIVHKSRAGRVGDIVINTLGKATKRLEDDIIGYWHFDEGTGTSTLDASGNGNNGELKNGLTWVAASGCKAGQCLSFDGVDDYVDAGNDESLNITDAITIEAWAYINLSANHEWIVRKGWGGAPFFFGKNSENEITLTINDVSGTWFDGAPVTAGWHHVAGTYDGSARKIYIDGTLKATFTNVSGPINVNDDHLGIGGYNGGSNGQMFNGLIDEVRIYNTALSSSTIRAHYEDLK